MRKIKTKDVFALARLIKNAGMKDELTEALKASSAEDAREVGINFMMSLISACGNEETEKGIYSLIGQIAEKTPEAIEDMNLDELVDTLKEISDHNNLSNFFDAAVKSA